MAKTYVQPSKELIKYTCPHCNTLSQMDRGGIILTQIYTKSSVTE